MKRSCLVCGKIFHVVPAIVRSGYGNFCSIKCKGIAKRVAKKVCPVCGKELRVTVGAKKGKFCSIKCFGISARKKKVDIICAQCGKALSLDLHRTKNVKNNFCSRECHDKYQRRNTVKAVCKICGKEFTMPPGQARQRKSAKYCSMKCRNSDEDFIEFLAIQNQKQQQRRKGLNKLELAGKEILNDLGIKFCEQVLMFKRFVVDVLLLEHRVIVQWDGDYWHCHPKYENPNKVQLRIKAKDKAVNAYLKKCGYRVLRFWESDVKQKPDYVRRKIVSQIRKMEAHG